MASFCVTTPSTETGLGFVHFAINASLYPTMSCCAPDTFEPHADHGIPVLDPPATL